LEVKDLVVRYRAELPAVLKGISFTVAPAQKVGICGRTGCGKSTLMLALYRSVCHSASFSCDVSVCITFYHLHVALPTLFYVLFKDLATKLASIRLKETTSARAIAWKIYDD
jgi:ABC-type glutathione transport system ATPase component